jgi:hypothetical protein
MEPYKRLLEERAEEEQRRDEPLPKVRDLDSKVLARRLVNTPQDRPKYTADLSIMYRLITRGPRNAGEGMRLGSLKAKYCEEYGEPRSEWQGQQEPL